MTLDSHHVIDSPTASIMEHMVETLVALTPDGRLEPRLAEKWVVPPDSTEFTFTIRKGIKFHDGAVLNAEAVKINLERRLDPKAATKFGFLVAMTDSVTVVDEYTVKIKTKYPFALMLADLSHTTNGILSPVAIKASWDKPLTAPVGTGEVQVAVRIPPLDIPRLQAVAPFRH